MRNLNSDHMTAAEKREFYKELFALAILEGRASKSVIISIVTLATDMAQWPVMLVYILMCMDEIVKVPFLYPRYKKYLWLTNLTRE